ncbi:MAG: cytotoxin [Oscillospiraceae bacterium]|nr:cytotoxin [Oscillospiraceae bacterium]MCL2278852.1 cytotoxin [Oscillospiraceae bacterium]
MSFEFTYSAKFKKHYKKLSAPEKKQVAGKLVLLSKNPTHPSLRTKRIQGTDRLFESSANMDVRIIWYYEGDKLIALIDVGHHDVLKKY